MHTNRTNIDQTPTSSDSAYDAIQEEHNLVCISQSREYRNNYVQYAMIGSCVVTAFLTPVVTVVGIMHLSDVADYTKPLIITGSLLATNLAATAITFFASTKKVTPATTQLARQSYSAP